MRNYSNCTAPFRIFTGARDVKGISDAIKNDLCNLCNGTCATSSSKEPYYSYEGAFKCMAEGNNDRVGFVKETTADAVLADYPKYGSKADYELLCKNGTKTGLLFILHIHNIKFPE